MKITPFLLVGTVILSGTFYIGVKYGQIKNQKERRAGVLPTPPTTMPLVEETPAPKSTKGPTIKPGWKLYKDEEVGYSIQYPDSWFLDNKRIELGGGKPLSQKTTQILWITTHRDMPSHQAGDLGKEDNVRLGINYIENKEGLSLREQMRRHSQPDFVDNPPDNIKSMWMIIDGLEAHRYIYYPGNKWGSPGVYTTIQLKNGDFIKIVAIILHEFDSYLSQVIGAGDSFKVL